MRRRLLAGIAVSMLLALAGAWLPALAGAVTFCVEAPACDGRTAPTIAAALNRAASRPGADRIEVGRGTFEEGPLTIDDPAPLTLIGARERRTTVKLAPDAPLPPSPVLTVESAGARVKRLRVEVTVTGALGLDMRAGAGSHLTVAGDPAIADAVGARLLGAPESAPTLRRSKVTMPLSGATLALFAHGGGRLARVTARGTTGVRLNGSDMTRGRVVASATGIEASDATVQDSTIRPGAGAGAGFVGLEAAGLRSGDQVLASHVTVAGDGTGTGIEAKGQCDVIFKQADDMTLLLLNSVVSGFATDLSRRGTTGPPGDCGPVGGPPPAAGNLAVAYSRYDPAKVAELGEGTLTVGPGNTSAAPRFVDAAAGDLHLRRSSPLVDAGSPKPLAAAELPVDLDGNPRIADGNGDGTPRRDMGAYERPPP